MSFRVESKCDPTVVPQDTKISSCCGGRGVEIAIAAQKTRHQIDESPDEVASLQNPESKDAAEEDGRDGPTKGHQGPESCFLRIEI